MSSPYFSIVLPTYNRETFLSKAIESVINQSFTDWELLIVDDGSTDNTSGLVATYKDARIRYIYQENQERSVARNNGIANALGTYICFLDSDDYYLESHLEQLFKEIQKLQEPVAFLYAGLIIEEVDKTQHKKEIIAQTGSTIDFLHAAMIGTPQVCIHSSILRENQFNPALNIGEDMELWFRLADNYVIHFVPTFNVVATNHAERSVNEKQFNSYLKHYQMLQIAYKAPHPGSKASNQVKATMLSDTFFGIARYYMYNQQSLHAIYWLKRSLFSSPFHPQSKHKIYCLLALIPPFNFILKKQYQVIQ